MAEHRHVFVYVVRVPGPAVLVQRCACGQPGPMSPVPVGRAPRRAFTPYA